ncbi:MAG: tetratricopeptide repeat protein [Chitinophagaceae bacterium]|nr:tetratricopeptide repeat protein [Rubrivivax sp.]
MAGSLNFAAPTALEYFAALVADDASLPLPEAAIAVAQDDEPQLDALGVLAQIDALAERLRRRIPADAPPLQRLRLLNSYFFQELGFAGNVNDYHDRRNSYLHEVLRTRRGIPITLALLYIEIAQQVGLRASGVSFPGHFLVKLHLPRGEVILDPFNGQSLSRDNLEERLTPFRHRIGLNADDEAPLGLYLQTAAPREVLARLLRNLKELHRGAGDLPRLAAVLQRLVVLLPQAWEERRDRALVMAELGELETAVHDLTLYLRHRPQADDADLLQRQLRAWRHAPGARLQ